ncbi:MAG: hypothetical protein JSV80_16670 [Acidobacteriota bacterium]|nr:MAG: hypothetical protein JSV80_16670 [Acidobacteriota bacterium]
MPIPQAGQVRVVARYRDGRKIRGTTRDFYPNKPEFHVHELGHEAARATTITLDELKAVFFVRTFEGDRQRAGHRSGSPMGGGFAAPSAASDTRRPGRRLRIRFFDGEELIGFTVGYNTNHPGFFIVPAEAASNNERVYVVHRAVDKIEWC